MGMSAMPAVIKLHRLNGQEFTLEVNMIEAVEAIPTTVIVLSTGNRFFVRETPDEVTALIREHRRDKGNHREPSAPHGSG